MLKIGDTLPNITLQGSDDQSHQLTDYIGNPLVIYFYPKNETRGCTAEACAFRDQFEDFTSIGAKVIGISRDSVNSHKRFIKNRRLPFLLLSDSKKVAETKFGVPSALFGLIPGRVTFVFDSKGKVIHTFNSATNPVKHIRMALDSLKRNQNDS